MAAPSSSLINLDDEKHPYAYITRMNQGSCLFKKLPLEIRLAIYEYAVAIDKPVRPKQKAPRSNKFIWGDYLNDHFSYLSMDLINVEEPLAIISLSRTCRAIYQELEDHPVFYRVNEFEFRLAKDIHAFLAAIVPKRLEMIRTIRLLTPGPFQEDWSAPRTGSIDHILTLLSRCCDLRKLYLVIQDAPGINSKAWIREWSIMAHRPHDIPALINLPVLCPLVQLIWNGTELHLKKFLEEMPDHPFLHRDLDTKSLMRSILGGLNERKEAFALESKGQHSHDSRPKWLKDMATKDAINAAVVAAPVDFTGRNRIAQDFSLIRDEISSRTRRKSKHVDSLGVIRRDVPKYNADGLLVWEHDEILGIRWSDSGEAEISLSWVGSISVRQPSWEPFHAFVMDRRGEEGVLRYFREKMIYGGRGKAHLQKMKSTPSVSDIAKLAGGLKSFLGKNRTQRGHNRIAAWTYWAQKYDDLVKRLEAEYGWEEAEKEENDDEITEKEEDDETTKEE
ncbi:hypothetical protein F5Y11DRAFT_345158 [Daldinia sp. FL1419]|nr:hypothetical protein F5Y11DRAFT_345158 [Daldinia sp. FL1419]